MFFEKLACRKRSGRGVGPKRKPQDDQAAVAISIVKLGECRHVGNVSLAIGEPKSEQHVSTAQLAQLFSLAGEIVEIEFGKHLARFRSAGAFELDLGQIGRYRRQHPARQPELARIVAPSDS